MTRFPVAPPGRSLALALTPLLALPLPALSQQNDADFLFGRPVVSFTLYGGYALASADSEIFDFVRDQLTLEREDFHAPSIGFEAAYRVSERVDLAADFNWSKSSSRSEFRDWIGTDDLPIEQTTRLTRRPLTLNVKWYLRDRGRTVSRLAWVPRSWSPYIGAGAGLVWYTFEQDGEFVDFETLEIFRDNFRSEGAAPIVQLLGGVDVSISPRFTLRGDARYGWASDEMGRDFVDFDDIDLSGFQASVGISARFENRR